MKEIPKCPECSQEPKGTAETVAVTALLSFDEEGNARYAGGSEVHWDTQRTLTDASDRLLLVCPNGHEFAAPDGFEVG